MSFAVCVCLCVLSTPTLPTPRSPHQTGQPSTLMLTPTVTDCSSCSPSSPGTAETWRMLLC